MGEDVPLEKTEALKRQRISYALSTLSEKSDSDEDQNLLSCDGFPKFGERSIHRSIYLYNLFKKKLEALWEADPTDDILGEVVDAKLSLNLEYDMSELYWEQHGGKIGYIMGIVIQLSSTGMLRKGSGGI
ncbi:hypothetical protein V6N12_055508 [Hibiscus sabdariffa]|uniref:Uncharacterized protein n=1 Tax=Hibiscus sabdariffa TaxID=183260 RepID=A0ABR2BU47_9ROSI